jgi:hypothetical protein
MKEPYSSETDLLISKFVHLTAGTYAFSYEGSANYMPYKNSPIVNYGRPINKVGNVSLEIGNLSGGAAPPKWLIANRAKTNKTKLKLAPEATLDYDIFGHQPQGFLPTAYRQSKTLHVCLDISKLETGGTNNYSFTFLILEDGAEPRFIGRILFPVSPSTIYNSSNSGRKTNMYKERIVYYNEVVSGSELTGRKIPGTDVRIQYTPKPPPVFQERAIIRNVAENNLGRVNTSLFSGGRHRSKTRRNRTGRRHTRSHRK